MTQDSLRFRADRLAEWSPRLAIVLFCAAPLVLAGCSDTTAPDGAETPKNVSTQIEMPVDPPTISNAALAVTVPRHGRWIFTGTDEQYLLTPDSGDWIHVQWRGVYDDPGSSMIGYRYGWDVQDPDDPDDPGWFGPPRSDYKSQQTQPRQFWDGTSFLTIERWDGDNLQVRVVLEVWVPPVTP